MSKRYTIREDMRRKCITLMAAFCAILIGIVGCNLSDAQVKIIARSSGMGAAITWIAIDNPDTEAKTSVSDALVLIKDNAALVSTNSYVDVVYPLVAEYTQTSTDIKPQYKPLVLAGSLAVLNGIDLFFMTNPDWSDKEDLAVGIVDAFVQGAQTGLALSNTDPRIVQARNTATIRAKIYNH